MRNSKYSVTLESIESYKNAYIPQANNLDKVVLVIKVLKHSYINEKDVSLALSFSDRQALYYADALRFLDLIHSFKYGTSTMIGLRENVLKYFKSGSIEKNLRKYIHDGLYIERYEQRLEDEKVSNNQTIDEETIKRRTNSLLAWKRWMNE